MTNKKVVKKGGWWTIFFIKLKYICLYIYVGALSNELSMTNYLTDHMYSANKIFVLLEPAVERYKDATNTHKYMTKSLKNADTELAGAKKHLDMISMRLEMKMYEMEVSWLKDECETHDECDGKECDGKDQTCEPRIINKYKATRGYTRHQIKAPIVSKHAVQNAWKEKHKIARQRQSRLDNYEP